MSNISLYGVVRSFIELDAAAGRVIAQRLVPAFNKSNLHQMTLEDHSGSVVIQLLFTEGRRAEKLEIGHTVFIAGLMSHTGPSNRLDCFWNEKDALAELVNITQLPALLTSPCLYQLVPLHLLSRDCFGVQVCRVCIKDIKLDRLTSKPLRDQCQHYVDRDVCHRSECTACLEKESTTSIVMALEIYDRHNEVDGVCIALCFGQPAIEILQASAEDFLSWPEDEQALYLYNLQKEEYTAAMYDGSGDHMQNYSFQGRDSPWRIGQALKAELDDK